NISCRFINGRGLCAERNFERDNRSTFHAISQLHHVAGAIQSGEAGSRVAEADALAKTAAFGIGRKTRAVVTYLNTQAAVLPFAKYLDASWFDARGDSVADSILDDGLQNQSGDLRRQSGGLDLYTHGKAS